MSNRIVIDEKELNSRIASAFQNSKFKETSSPIFTISSHPVNPLSLEELTEKLNLVYKFTNGTGVPADIKNEFDSKYKKDYPVNILLIIYKHKLVWKLFYSKTEWYGASYRIEENDNVVLDFKFLNKDRI